MLPPFSLKLSRCRLNLDRDLDLLLSMMLGLSPGKKRSRSSLACSTRAFAPSVGNATSSCFLFKIKRGMVHSLVSSSQADLSFSLYKSLSLSIILTSFSLNYMSFSCIRIMSSSSVLLLSFSFAKFLISYWDCLYLLRSFLLMFRSLSSSAACSSPSAGSSRSFTSSARSISSSIYFFCSFSSCFRRFLFFNYLLRSRFALKERRFSRAALSF